MSGGGAKNITNEFSSQRVPQSSDCVSNKAKQINAVVIYILGLVYLFNDISTLYGLFNAKI